MKNSLFNNQFATNDNKVIQVHSCLGFCGRHSDWLKLPSETMEVGYYTGWRIVHRVKP